MPTKEQINSLSDRDKVKVVENLLHSCAKNSNSVASLIPLLCAGRFMLEALSWRNLKFKGRPKLGKIRPIFNMKFFEQTFLQDWSYSIVGNGAPRTGTLGEVRWRHSQDPEKLQFGIRFLGDDYQGLTGMAFNIVTEKNSLSGLRFKVYVFVEPDKREPDVIIACDSAHNLFTYRIYLDESLGGIRIEHPSFISGSEVMLDFTPHDQDTPVLIPLVKAQVPEIDDDAQRYHLATRYFPEIQPEITQLINLCTNLHVIQAAQFLKDFRQRRK